MKRRFFNKWNSTIACFLGFHAACDGITYSRWDPTWMGACACEHHYQDVSK